jgi:hypothetical protein
MEQMADTTLIPSPRVPVVDADTGLITTHWFRFLNNQFLILDSSTSSNLAGGVAGEVPFQSAPNKTTFSVNLLFNSTRNVLSVKGGIGGGKF